jgi:hypothetical protein
MRKISGFFISVLMPVSLWCSAQDTLRYPINDMKGIRIGIDMAKFVLPAISHGERKGFELSGDMHVKGNFFAVAESGWLNVNLRDTAFHYRSNGFYGRLGIDYNLLKSRRPGSNDLFYAGFRYGVSLFSHQADDVYIMGHYWPDAPSQSIPKTALHAHWIEFLAGVKAEVLKNFYIGIIFRGKFRVVAPSDKYSKPYQIPGYGAGSSKFVLGLNYYFSYNIHF